MTSTGRTNWSKPGPNLPTSRQIYPISIYYPFLYSSCPSGPGIAQALFHIQMAATRRPCHRLLLAMTGLPTFAAAAGAAATTTPTTTLWTPRPVVLTKAGLAAVQAAVAHVDGRTGSIVPRWSLPARRGAWPHTTLGAHGSHRNCRHLATAATPAPAQPRRSVPHDGDPCPTSAFPTRASPAPPDPPPGASPGDGDDGRPGPKPGPKPGPAAGLRMMVRALDPSTKHQLGILGAGLAVISLGYGMVIPALPQFAAAWGDVGVRGGVPACLPARFGRVSVDSARTSKTSLRLRPRCSRTTSPHSTRPLTASTCSLTAS